MTKSFPSTTAPLLLQAGPLRMEWEAGGLRYVKFAGKEIVRRIYAAVRDANWGTVPDEISNVELQQTEDSFRLTYDVRCLQNEIDFSWRGTIVGEARGRIEFVMEGASHSTFRRNRIGFCILHPMELAGTAVEVTQADGTRRHSEFPRYIAAENPFLNLVGLRHAAGPDANVQITCEGDIFETEDQRNWSDASYKTFCTPLSQPFPAEVKAGDRVCQRIVIDVAAQSSRTAVTPQQNSPVVLDVGKEATLPLPKIGFALNADAPALSEREIELIHRLQPAHVQFDVRLPGTYDEEIAQAARLAADLNAELDLALHVGPEAEGDVERFLACLQRVGAHVARWTLFAQRGWWTTRNIVERYAGLLKKWNSNLPLGGGTPASFCELNRNRPPLDLLDFVTWSMQPQEHAFDNRSLVETLAAQGAIVESARQFCGALPLIVGPITLKKRVNPVATGPWPPEPAAGELPLQVDPRQATLFGAGWTLSSVKYLAESGASAATYYELVGWKGLMERKAGSPLPERFSSVPGGVFPLYHVFADLAEYDGGYVVPVRSSSPLSVEALALAHKPHGRPECLLIANLSASDQRVLFPMTAPNAKVLVMSENNVIDAVHSPEAFRRVGFELPVRNQQLELDLPRHAVARIDLQ